MNTSVIAALKEELQTIEKRKLAIENFLSVYQNGEVVLKPGKPRASGSTYCRKQARYF